MVTHLVLLKPRPDLSSDGREHLVAAFERAIREVPTVRGVRVGRRIVFGASYEARMPDAADYVVLIEFDDVDGLEAYLHHPSHAELGARFSDSLAAALVFDFESVGLEGLRDLR
jgi:Stress responsive A/B Barrel Domain